MNLTGEELEILRRFVHTFKWTFKAFIRLVEDENGKRLTEGERLEFLGKLGLEEK